MNARPCLVHAVVRRLIGSRPVTEDHLPIGGDDMLRVGSIVIRVDDLERQAQFWQGALGYERRVDQRDKFAHLYPSDGNGPNVSLDALHSEARVPPRIHLDLYTDDRGVEVQRLIDLGASVIPWDRRPPDANYVVMEDPEGNRFCVIDA